MNPAKLTIATFTENASGTAGQLKLSDGVHTATVNLFGQFAAGMTSARNGQGACKLLNLQKFPTQVLKMVGLLSLFQVYDDLDTAVASFSSGK